MGKIYFQPTLSDDIENKFREKANKRYENRKGSFNNTLIDLITDFVEGTIELPEKKE
jgi:hypothetical protein